MTIKPAKNKTLDANLPNMYDVIRGWFRKMSCQIVSESIVDFEVVETLTDYDFQGVIQPLNSKDLINKPEGQRAWQWYQIHSDTNLPLNIDDIIIIDSEKYRIMNIWTYPLYGFYEYHIIKDYEEEE